MTFSKTGNYNFEDHSRIRAGHVAENLATVRRAALNLLKQEDSMKAGITRKRKRAGGKMGIS